MTPRAGYVCYEHAPPGPRQQAAIAATIRKAMAAPDRYLAALAEETDEHLAIQLGCPPRLVWRLRLAGWPRADQWAADVDGIAASMDAEPARLGSLMRRLERC